MPDSTQRFSSRVETYLKYRPHYPSAVIETLVDRCQLLPASIVADVGSGTGFLSELFLANNNLVYAVEPNREMRLAGETYCQGYSNFRSVNGTAEATTLAEESVDFVVAGQAFHWFDPKQARREFLRILKPGGWVAVVWIDRDPDSTPFLWAYEQLLQDYATDYRQVTHKNIHESVFSDFFGEGNWSHQAFDYRQLFDYEGIKGRLMSSSYAPQKEHPKHAPMLARLSSLFQTYSTDDLVSFKYKTRVFYGQLL